MYWIVWSPHLKVWKYDFNYVLTRPQIWFCFSWIKLWSFFWSMVAARREPSMSICFNTIFNCICKSIKGSKRLCIVLKIYNIWQGVGLRTWGELCLSSVSTVLGQSPYVQYTNQNKIFHASYLPSLTLLPHSFLLAE